LQQKEQHSKGAAQIMRRKMGYTKSIRVAKASSSMGRDAG